MKIIRVYNCMTALCDRHTSKPETYCSMHKKMLKMDQILKTRYEKMGIFKDPTGWYVNALTPHEGERGREKMDIERNIGYGWNPIREGVNFSTEEIETLKTGETLARGPALFYRIPCPASPLPEAPIGETQLWEPCEECGSEPSYATGSGHLCHRHITPAGNPGRK